MKIKRPIWYRAMLPYNLTNEDSASCSEAFDRWFDEQIEPINKLFEDAVEVRKFEHSLWSTHAQSNWFSDENKCSHKALLIDIQPIKKETAEDVLRDMTKYVNSKPLSYGHELHRIVKRAKAVLNEQYS